MVLVSSFLGLLGLMKISIYISFCRVLHVYTRVVLGTVPITGTAFDSEINVQH